MKHPRLIRTLAVVLSAVIAPCLSAVAATQVGPKGGRLLDVSPAPVEFFVTADHHVQILFYDRSMQEVAPTSQVVTVTAEVPGGRVALDMEKTDAGFVSKQPVPEGAPYRMVVQVRSEPGEKPQNFRLDLNLAMCGECSHPEYACTCEGH